MNTPVHLLMGVAACGRPGGKARNVGALAGAFVPDATIIAMVAWQGWVVGRTGGQIFGIDYFTAFWQEIFAVSNSVPLFAACAALGVVARRHGAVAFGIAGILHVLTDIPLHAGDGHPPFWPFSDWIYASPFSYWDVRHGAHILAPAEFILCLVLAVWLWTRFRELPARLAIALGVLVEAAFVFGGDVIYGA